MTDGGSPDGAAPRDAAPDEPFPDCGAGFKCSLPVDAAPPPSDPCGATAYAHFAGKATAKCSPPPIPCGDGTPECTQLCEDLRRGTGLRLRADRLSLLPLVEPTFMLAQPDASP